MFSLSMKWFVKYKYNKSNNLLKDYYCHMGEVFEKIMTYVGKCSQKGLQPQLYVIIIKKKNTQKIIWIELIVL